MQTTDTIAVRISGDDDGVTTTTTTTNTSSTSSMLKLHYLHGLGNELESECLPGALPQGRNNPRIVPYQLYTEQLSGTAFTAPRCHTKRTWLYRIQPSVAVAAADAAAVVPEADTKDDRVPAPAPTLVNQRQGTYLGHCSPRDCQPVVDALRWNPLPVDHSNKDNNDNDKKASTDFWDALQLQCHAGDPAARQGLAIYQYVSSTSSSSSASAFVATNSYCNADGDFLIVPSRGTLLIATELGRLTVKPTEICVIPRGLVYSVASLLCDDGDNDNDSNDEPQCRGYVLEIYSAMGGFQLPELGPIGSNGLANPRDFLHPVAWCAATTESAYHQPHTIITKQQSELFVRHIDHSPYNVVAWHGNYLPYKYDLHRFCAVNSVTYDHLDPSLYTVLTCPLSGVPGTALADFVIFPPRVLATDPNTLRPPWFHRNVMSEYMGLIYGQYDAKQQQQQNQKAGNKGGFQPGGASLHNNLTPHGPDAHSYEQAVRNPCTEPTRWNGGLAFMFETALSLSVAPRALGNDDGNVNDCDDDDNPTTRTGGWRDMHYTDCWQDLTADHFDGWEALAKAAQEQQLPQPHEPEKV